MTRIERKTREWFSRVENIRQESRRTSKLGEQGRESRVTVAHKCLLKAEVERRIRKKNSSVDKCHHENRNSHFEQKIQNINRTLLRTYDI